MYVGITQQDPEVRWQKGNGYRKQGLFWNAIKKYSWDGFEHIIVASGISDIEAWELEKQLISKYKTTDRAFGYNISVGGEAGAKGVERSEKNKRACSQALKQLWGNDDFRVNHLKVLQQINATDEVRLKRAKSQIGRRVSEETRKKISNRKMGKKLGPFTDEHKAKMRLNHAGGADRKSVICVETGVYYASINDASSQVGINKKQISNCCRNIPHYNTAGGFHWVFAEG